MVTTDLLFYILYKLNVIQGMIFAMRQVHKSMPNFKDFCSMWCWISFLQEQKTCALKDLEYPSKEKFETNFIYFNMKRNSYCKSNWYLHLPYLMCIFVLQGYIRCTRRRKSISIQVGRWKSWSCISMPNRSTSSLWANTFWYLR